MARITYQRGTLQWHDGQWTLLYRNRESGRSVQVRERIAFKKFKRKGDKRAARLAADDFMRAVNERNNANPAAKPPPADEPMTFARFIQTRWASYVVKQKMEPSTQASYQSIIDKHLVPTLGSRVLAEIVPADLTTFFDGSKGLKPKTLTNFYGLLNTIFDIAVDYDDIQVSPLREKLHKPETEKVSKPVLDPRSLQSILARLPVHHRLFVALLFVLPIRSGEGLALRWLNVDFEARTVTLTHGLWRGKLKPTLKTKASNRRFILPQALLDALAAHRVASEFARNDDFVFTNAIGGPLDPDNFRKRVLYPVMDELGIERESRTHGLHILRHTAATILHEQTGDIEVAQRALGHARRSTTEAVYDHAEMIVDEEITGLLMQAVIGETVILQSESIN